MRVTLNLASRPFADLGPAIRRLRIAMASLAVLCLLFGIGLYFFDQQAAEARAREHSLDGQIARIRTERQNAEIMMRQPANARLLDQTQVLNQLFDEKAFSWTLAMESMETVLPAGVQVTSIEPMQEHGEITVHLRVLGPHDRAVELVRNLEHSRRFFEPRITGESAESTNSPNQRQEPVSASNRFDVDLLAEYNPPTLEERAAVKTKKSSEPSGSIPHRHSRALPAPAPGFPKPRGRQPYTGQPRTAPMPPQNRPGGPQ